VSELAEKNGMDRDTIWKVCDELSAKGFIECRLSGGMAEPATYGLQYCEDNELIDAEIILEQNRIRTKLLATLVSWKDYLLASMDQRSGRKRTGLSEQREDSARFRTYQESSR